MKTRLGTSPKVSLLDFLLDNGIGGGNQPLQSHNVDTRSQGSHPNQQVEESRGQASTGLLWCPSTLTWTCFTLNQGEMGNSASVFFIFLFLFFFALNPRPIAPFLDFLLNLFYFIFLPRPGFSESRRLMT